MEPGISGRTSFHIRTQSYLQTQSGPHLLSLFIEFIQEGCRSTFSFLF